MSKPLILKKIFKNVLALQKIEAIFRLQISGFLSQCEQYTSELFSYQLIHKMQSSFKQQISQIFQQEPVTVFGCGVYKQDLLSLQPNEWLRSEAITLLCLILQQQYGELFATAPNMDKQKKQNFDSELKLLPCKIVSPLVTSMLLFMGDQQYILQSMESQNLFSYRYLLIPSNTETQQQGTGSHWFLMIYDTLNNMMYTMDSAYQCVHKNAKIMGRRLQAMRMLFDVEANLKQKLKVIAQSYQLDSETKQYLQKVQITKPFQVKWLKNVIKQQNSYDCGIYVVGNIQRILKALKEKKENRQNQSVKSQNNPLHIFEEFQIEISGIKAEKQFFRDLRFTYFRKAFQTLKNQSQSESQIKN